MPQPIRPMSPGPLRPGCHERIRYARQVQSHRDISRPRPLYCMILRRPPQSPMKDQHPRVLPILRRSSHHRINLIGPTRRRHRPEYQPPHPHLRPNRKIPRRISHFPQNLRRRSIPKPIEHIRPSRPTQSQPKPTPRNQPPQQPWIAGAHVARNVSMRRHRGQCQITPRLPPETPSPTGGSADPAGNWPGG